MQKRKLFLYNSWSVLSGFLFVEVILSGSLLSSAQVTTGTLINEMTDLKRLTELSDHPYKYIQFSSYDRRSTSVSEPGWFANSDGFGNEPIPGFEEVLKAPDENGAGEYLICDVKGPGAILRLWTARINGNIRLYLDGNNTPVYDGDAQVFFWETAEKLSQGAVSHEIGKAFRQFDATYFPVPFAKSCRIEWIGDIRKLHFYHVGIRLYEAPCEVETFSQEGLVKYLPRLEKVCGAMDTSGKDSENIIKEGRPIESAIPKKSRKELMRFIGSGSIEYFSVKVSGNDLPECLRRNILNIYFDGSPSPQVQSPIGDFFGAAPGINPYRSLPFSVHPDGTMVCRFLMPFRDSVRIEIENHSGEDILVTGKIGITGYEWKPGKSMYFNARWRISHQLTASGKFISDIPYLLAHGTGRVVGASAYIFNPSDAPASYGNWWGEGDEKIFTDGDTSPSIFGTGSEDYFNYSWSSPDIFSLPFCGQPRNDGPGNRGFASNYRWHILDDIPFTDRLAFYMELRHHGEVPGFAYGRMVYLYSLPGLLDDHVPVSLDNIREQTLPDWSPVAIMGSKGYRLINAEEMIPAKQNIRLEEGELWAGGKIIVWYPSFQGDQITLSLPGIRNPAGNKLVITFAHFPEGGEVSVYLNGNLTEFNKKQEISLFEPNHQVLRNHTSAPVQLNEGDGNELTIRYTGAEKNKKVGIDFVWIKDQ